jgi:ATP-dependent Lhr-like helicase
VQPNVFASLHPLIQSGLEALGISQPTPPQKAAIKPIQNGENLLLISPTASGKTEAVLLPIFDSFLKLKPRQGISILYITPLRALNRDIHKRMMFWGDHLGIDVQVRHGDTSQKIRRKQSRKPPQMLITTPETLQAILPTKAMRKHLQTVKWIIVDEIHELASSKRGAQLTLGIERLELATINQLQRIGLSATVGNPNEVAQFLGGQIQVTSLEVQVDKSYVYQVEYPEPKDEDYDLSDKLDISPQAASRLNRVLNLVNQQESTLIFVQGRGQAESLGHKLGSLTKNIEVHHGSLSREQRHTVEDQFKAGEIKAIVCTSTLQLGIDVGKVDLCIQYLSPRQVSTLIQRVGRAGHTISRLSKGITIPAYGEDALEALVASERARKKKLEPTVIQIKPLDVLTHQIVGLTLSHESGITLIDLHKLISKAYPFREFEESELLVLVDFLKSIGLIIKKEDILMKTGKGRKYYYENLGMINDERRYPFINAVTDNMVGTVGDEFWSLRARLGLNVILKGRVWRILQIDEERGVIHAIPSTDPLGALPGWDGELIPVSKEVAQQVGNLRKTIKQETETTNLQQVADKLKADSSSIKAIYDEAKTHIKSGIPLPSPNHIVIEAYDRYLIIHSTYGENVNRTIGAILDSTLSEADLIYGWWNDPYRILIEAPHSLDKYEIEKIENIIKSLNEKDVESLLMNFMEARFPFGYKMKFIAERFGVIPRGKIMGYDRIENLYYRFKNTPIYKETLREAHQDKLDVPTTKKIIKGINKGLIQVTTKTTKNPSILARHILEKYADVEELIATDFSIEDQFEYMKKSINSRAVNLACVNCGEWFTRERIRELDDNPRCKKCGSGLLALTKRHQDPEYFLSIINRWKKGDEILGDEKDILVHGRKTADMILSYGKKAVEALMIHGVGPVTSYQVLSRMHRDEKEFYSDLLKAKIQYMRTRQYWDKKE